MNTISQERFNYQVSSVLNKDVKQFGKKHLFDGKDDTSWNSEQGSPQWILVELKDHALISSFSLQFQGGFVGKDCSIKIISPDNVNYSQPFYPEDNNSEQLFKLEEAKSAKSLQLYFSSSSDFFGRIIIYQLKIFEPS